MASPPPDALVGHCKIPCGQFDGGCNVDAGTVLIPIPRPRHNWGDVIVCPNDGCDRAFLVWKDRKESAPTVECKHE